MSSTSNSKNNNNNQSSSEDDWLGDLLVSVLTGIGHLLWWGVRFPLLGGPTAVAVGIGVWQGLNAGFLTALALLVAFTLWMVFDEPGFDRWVINPPRRYYQRWSRYLRRWEQVCALHGLTATLGERTLVPVLGSVLIGGDTDVLDVQLVTGQSTADWNKQAAALAATFKADRLTITTTAPGQVRITIMRGDVLGEPVVLPIPAPGDPVDLAAVPVGVTETGRPWRLGVLGHHILVAGATGAGKGSVLWSLIAALAPDVKTGRVRLCVIDPKGGMELGAGAPMFSFFSHDATGRTLELLHALVNLMHQRTDRLRGHTRLHTPTHAEPLFVVVIDEIAALTAYVTDRKIRAEIDGLLGLLLSQGRAVGISVVAAVQDPSKDTLPLRQLFTTRIGLRLTEATQTAMVLGQGTRDAGAECDRISDATPGVGYVLVDGTAQPVRVRAFYVTDDDITHLARTFGAPRPRTGGTRNNGHSVEDRDGRQQ